MVFVLTESNSVANEFVAELRDRVVQQDRARFRKNMERLGSIMAFEISKKLRYKKAETETPLGRTLTQRLENQPVLVTILRAGLPYYQGFQNFFDRSDAGFIGAYRSEGADSLTIKLDYLASTALEGRDVILIDPMLATGKSVTDSIKALLKNGTPRYIHIAALVAAPEGIKYLEEHLKVPHSIWTVAMDEKLNTSFYIVPGLGDAGDLSFGEKL